MVAQTKVSYFAVPNARRPGAKFSTTPLQTTLNKSTIYLTCLLAILYAGGVVFLKWPLTHALALALTPWHLLLTTGLVLWLHPVKTAGFNAFCGVACLAGFGAEVWGVNTGQLFGQYAYGPVLGFGLWHTPLIIGVNWLLLTYLMGQAIYGLAQPAWIKAIIIGLLMTGFDALIEPVAMELGFWQWPGGVVDGQNYLGWFACATLIGYAYERLVQGRNPVAIWVLLMNVVFFLALR